MIKDIKCFLSEIIFLITGNIFWFSKNDHEFFADSSKHPDVLLLKF